MSEFLASMFSMLEDGGSELMSMFGFGEGSGAAGGGKGLLGSDGNMLSGVKAALRIAGGHGQQARSMSNATPYHFSTNANVDTVLNHEAGYMKNDINVGQGFNSLKNLF